METDDRQPEIPDRIRRAVLPDLRPVRPLRGPWTRAAALIPAAAILLVGIPWVLGLRADVVVLGPVLSFGTSALQLLAGIALIGLALRESVPGTALSPRVVWSSLAAGIALVITVTVSTFLVSPTSPAAELRARFFRYCFGYSTLAGVPLVLLAGFLAARALPLRPWVAGALYGLGAGLMSDAGWRLFCDVSTPGHVIEAHGGAILVLTVFGTLGAEVTERVRWWVEGRR